MTRAKQTSIRPLLRSAGVVGLMTLLSRLTGLVVQRMIASRLGLNDVSDAYQVAYRLPNMLRRFTAEGTMTAAFLPTLVDIDAKRGEAEAKSFAADFLGTLGAILLVICAAGVLLMTPITGLLMLGKLAPGASFISQLGVLWDVISGKTAFPDNIALGAVLGRIMFPYLLLVSITSAMAAVLNMRHRFALAASTNMWGNLVFIGVSWVAFHLMTQPFGTGAATVFACAMLLHGLVQILALAPTFKRMGFHFGWFTRFSNPDVRLALKRMLPGIIAGGIHPINVFVSQSLASQLPSGAQTVMANSNLLGELVLGLFAVSVATVSLPAMSRQASEGDRLGVCSSLGEALRGAALLVIPGAVGMAVLATPIIALIYHKGAFGAEAVSWTSATLPYQAVGLIFIASSRISTQALNAMKDYSGPALAAFVGFVCNVALSLVLMKPMGTNGMALANSFAALAGLVFQVWRLRHTLGYLPVKSVASGWLKMASAAALMGIVAWYGSGLLTIHDPFSFQGTAATAWRLFPLIGVCGAIYLGLALVFRIPEAKSLFRAVLKKII
ncbi:MAG: murein biosynthesis integral membrane protein MurJ [Holophagales bacterium]|jgi:putative peptidoglycan lipid II flippase|nr:murein biosynthesis integral membrane protein MurJ [Holophagales bacterium]